jgi:hypothetical protein
MSSKNVSFNVHGNHYGNNYQAETMNFNNAQSTDKSSELILSLQELKNIVQTDTFPVQEKKELITIIEEAQRNLSSTHPNSSFIDKVLKKANKYNSFFSGGQLLVTIGQLANDLFNQS